MDLTPYKNHESSLNRNRSLSCGSPLRNQVVYQEIYTFGQSTLVRSVSCNQVFSKDERGQTFETTQIQVASFITPEKNKQIKYFEPFKKSKLKLDESANFISDQPDLVNNGKTYIKIENKFDVKKSMCIVTKKVIFVALLSFLCYHLIYLGCNKTWNLKQTYNELEQNVYGQSEAIEKIKVILNKYNNTKDLHIVIFTGGVGVGKTYVSSIIYRNFPWSTKKIFFVKDLNNELYEKLVNSYFPTCGYYLMVVDDLHYQNADEAISYISTINLKKKKDDNILVILIYKAHTELERIDILAKHKTININYYHVPFQTLTKDAVKRCFLREMQNLKANIPESDLEELINKKMKYDDILKGTAGCKGTADDISLHM